MQRLFTRPIAFRYSARTKEPGRAPQTRKHHAPLPSSDAGADGRCGRAGIYGCFRRCASVEQLRQPRLAHLLRAGRDQHRAARRADRAHHDAAGAPRTAGAAACRPARPGLLGGGLFGGGMLGGLAAGFIGAGLFGMLFGHGFMGGMGGFASILGLLLQVGLVVIVARLAWAWWQRRNQPAMRQRPVAARQPVERSRPSAGGFRRSSVPCSAARAGGPGRRADRGDAGGLRRVREAARRRPDRLRPEDLAALRVHDDAGDAVVLLRGTGAERQPRRHQPDHRRQAFAGRPVGSLARGQRRIRHRRDALLAERQVVDRASGRVVEEEPSEATEFWTFRRARGGQWVLSAIQQT